VKDVDDKDEPAWHERTSTVVGASVGAVAVIGVLYLLISYMVGGSDEPGGNPQYYPDPSFSERSSASTTSSTSTETITSTVPPVTTDINPSDTTTSSTDTTSTTTTTTSFDPSNLPRTRASTTYGDGRQRPRLNETRTLYPRP
jgi:cytoskeletal protein RodZ